MKSNSFEELLAVLIKQEEDIQFSSFSNETAMKIGMMLFEEAKKNGKSVTIDINRNGQCLFHYAMEGTSPDNDQWIRRKNNTVNRFGHSSFYIGTKLNSEGKTLLEAYEISTDNFAAHGGAFPLIIKGTGIIGTITVSGLPQKEDHELVVNVLTAYLKTL